MLEGDSHAEDAEAVFRRDFREKLAARGFRGTELHRRAGELMNAPVRFRLDLSQDPRA
jgi:hypothetical protein